MVSSEKNGYGERDSSGSPPASTIIVNMFITFHFDRDADDSDFQDARFNRSLVILMYNIGLRSQAVN